MHRNPRSKPLDIELNNAIGHIVWRLFPNGFDVASDAPSTLLELQEHMSRPKARMLVWDGASTYTIFADPKVNYAFRAWHDWHHFIGGFEFNDEGERATCRAQCAQLIEMFGDGPTVQAWIRIIEAEIIGQLEYNKQHNGQFPFDQMAFVCDYLQCPELAVALTY